MSRRNFRKYYFEAIKSNTFEIYISRHGILHYQIILSSFFSYSMGNSSFLTRRVSMMNIRSHRAHSLMVRFQVFASNVPQLPPAFIDDIMWELIRFIQKSKRHFTVFQFYYPFGARSFGLRTDNKVFSHAICDVFRRITDWDYEPLETDTVLREKQWTLFFASSLALSRKKRCNNTIINHWEIQSCPNMELMFKHVSPICLGAKRGSMGRCGHIMAHLHSHAVGPIRLKYKLAASPLFAKCFKFTRLIIAAELAEQLFVKCAWE